MDKLIFDLLLAVTCAYGFMRGGWPERVAAILLCSAALASLVAVGTATTRFADVEFAAAMIDVALFLGLLLLSLTADRYWPMWICSMQLVTIWAHPAFGLAETKMPYAYALASVIWSFPMQLLLALGAWRHHVRQSRSGDKHCIADA